MALKFQTPPPDGRTLPPSRRGRHAAIAAELRAHPEEWALVMEDVASPSNMGIFKGRMVAYRPAGSFEAVIRTRSNGNYNIYARYVGEAPDGR
jgi:hypothetical protein